MRIIINVKYRKGQVVLDTRIDHSSTDKVSETNAGQALYDKLNEMFNSLNEPEGHEVKKSVA